MMISCVCARVCGGGNVSQPTNFDSDGEHLVGKLSRPCLRAIANVLEVVSRSDEVVSRSDEAGIVSAGWGMHVFFFFLWCATSQRVFRSNLQVCLHAFVVNFKMSCIERLCVANGKAHAGGCIGWR
jgi:hypothetical protein